MKKHEPTTKIQPETKPVKDYVVEQGYGKCRIIVGQKNTGGSNA